MSKFTDFLNLFMWDSIEDSEEEFNIDKALNDNWKKIDTKVKTHVTSVNEEINNFKEETNQKIENIQALPTGGTKGQVLTKQSETNGDANWEDIEANEVFVGNEEEAPSSAKIIVEDEDFEESAGLSKAEVYVGAEEPTTGEKVWFRKGKNYLDISKLKSRTTYGITFEPTATGIKITGTAQDVYAYGGSVSVELKKGKTYTLYGNNAGSTLKLELKKGTTIIATVKTSNNKITFTPNDDVNLVTFILEGIVKGTTYNYEISNLQIEPGSKAAPYEHYIEQKLFVRNSNGVYEELYNKEQINTLINRSSVGYSEVLYSDSTGVVAGSAGNAVILSKSVSNYAAILVVHQKGSCVVNNKLNTQNYGYGINIHWFNEGLAGTFYDNTVYKVVGLCKL